MSTILEIDPSWTAKIVWQKPLTFEPLDPGLDLPSHVRAGSGLRRWEGKLAIVQDDVNAIALYDEASGEIEVLPLPAGAGGRRQFSDELGNKADKMDLEGCEVLPDGRLLAIGSGSTTARERMVLVSPDRTVRVVDGSDFYSYLREHTQFAGSELNVEGLAVVGDKLRLFQRGNGAVPPLAAAADRTERPEVIAVRRWLDDGGATLPLVDLPVNATADFELAEFIAWLDDGGRVPRLITSQQFDLGLVRGVSLSFTDAVSLPDDHVVFLAAAEDSPDTYDDGEVVGAKIGMLGDGQVVLADIVNGDGSLSTLKFEGVEFIGFTGSGELELLAVTDMDDTETPALLALLRWGPPLTT